jgi:hypothetical protein
LTEEDHPLSPWWIPGLLIVLTLGFAGLIALRQYQQPLAILTRSQQAAVQAETAISLKINRYDAATATLHLTVPESTAYRRQIGYWADYFHHPSRNGSLVFILFGVVPLVIASIKGYLGVRAASKHTALRSG